MPHSNCYHGRREQFTSPSQSTDGNSEKDDDFIKIFDYMKEEDTKGVVKAHIPQSIGLAYIDENYKMLGYQSVISDKVLYEFPQILSVGIEKYM